MARCGCDTATSTTCEAIMACVAANLGPGLDYNEITRQLEVELSRDAGNAARIGTDGGFWAPAGAAPGPMTWPKTVATLPAQAIAATGGSNLVGPSTAPDLIEYAIANNLDIYTTSAFNLADQVPFGGPGSQTHGLNTYTDNPSNIDNKDLGSTNLSSLVYDAGTRVNPTGRYTGAPVEFLEPDGGWGGFYHRPYPAQTIAGLLRMVRGRIVVALHTQRLSYTQAEAEANVRSAVQTVIEAGAQAWVMIYIPGALDDNSRAPIDQWASIVTDAGITAGISLSGEHDMPDPWTPAELAATSATWLEVRGPSDPDGVSDARITELVGTGMNVQVYINDGRQYWTEHAFGLGARAIRAADGVYARGGRGQAGDLDYRQTFIPGLSTRTAAIGAMTPHTVDHTAVFNAGFARQDEPGRWFSARYGWDGDTAVYANHQVLGTVCPVPDTANFELRLRLFHGPNDNADSSRWAGIFWGAADDRDISQPVGGTTNTVRSGYNCVVFEPVGTEVTRMGIYRHDAGVSTTLNTASGGPGWAESEWVELIVTVTGGNINFQAVAEGTSGVATATDATYRGPYAYYIWNNSGVFAGQNLFWHGYDNGRTEAGELMVYAAQS